MWNCNDCGSNFDFPEIKRPDAGMVSGEGILGLRKIEPVMFCPECLSTKIERKDTIRVVERRSPWSLVKNLIRTITH